MIPKFKPGTKILFIGKEGEYLKIMAYADNYYMVRYKGCVPFVCTEKELENRISLNITSKPS